MRSNVTRGDAALAGLGVFMLCLVVYIGFVSFLRDVEAGGYTRGLATCSANAWEKLK